MLKVTKGNKKGSIESPYYLENPALIVAATQILLGHFTQLGTFQSNKTIVWTH